jgi:hypothetical protein
MNGDMRAWRADRPFDLVVAPCSSLSRLLTLDDQIAAWRCAWEGLAEGGRFVVDLTMLSARGGAALTAHGLSRGVKRGECAPLG